LARDRRGEYGHIGFRGGLCPLTLALELMVFFSFFRSMERGPGVAGWRSPCRRPPCSPMFIVALFDVMDDLGLGRELLAS
jgi:hypothetical protein